MPLCVIFSVRSVLSEAFKRSSEFFNKQIFVVSLPLPPSLYVMEFRILKSCTKKYHLLIHLPITALMGKRQNRISKTEAWEYLIGWYLEVCLILETCRISSDITTKVDIWNCVQKKDNKKSHTGWWATLIRYKVCSVLKKCAKLTTGNKHSHLVELQICFF